jgi:tetratricopeptide (TPR) repeat protein
LTNEGFIKTFIHTDKPHFEIQNELVRAYVHGKLPVKKKKSLAKKLAKALEQFCINLWGKDIPKWEASYLVQTANMFNEAENESKAPEYLLAAAKASLKIGDFSKGREFLTAILAFKTSDEILKGTLFQLGSICLLECKPKQSEEYYSKILPLIKDDPDEQIRILMQIAAAYQNVLQLDKVESIVDESNAIFANAGVEPSNLTRYRMNIVIGWNFNHRGNHQKAQTYCEKALEYASSIKDRRQVHRGLYWIFTRQRKYLEAIDHIQKAIKLTEKLDEKDALCRLILNMFSVLFSLGDSEQIEKYLEKALRIAEETKNPITLSHLMSRKSTFLSRQGLFRHALESIRTGIEIISRINHPLFNNTFKMMEATCLMNLGDWELARKKYLEIWKKNYQFSPSNTMGLYVLGSLTTIYI